MRRADWGAGWASDSAKKGARLDGGLQVGHPAQVGVCQRPRPGPLRGDAELERVQLSQEPALHLGVLRHQVQEEGACTGRTALLGTAEVSVCWSTALFRAGAPCVAPLVWSLQPLHK